ncbi:MAG TPA: hypothetical protein VFB37_12925 [Steroidobacteraceae bacterium]|nr:hypothetical protein [Steroidobacteraceae bacterium]
MQSVRIRAIVAGIELSGPADLSSIRKAVARLLRAREQAEEAGYEVQELRVATNPWAAQLHLQSRHAGLGALRDIDAMIVDAGMVLSIGPIVPPDAPPRS